MNLRKQITKLLKEELLSEGKNEIICFHRSHDFKHMLDGNLNMDMSNDVALFGPAIYFSESAGTSQQLGKYVCKFKIKLEAPILDMNSNITAEQAFQLVEKFNTMFNKSVVNDYNDPLFKNTKFQWGDIFVEIGESYNWDYNIHFTPFIRSLGYNSFIYYGNYHTDFINGKGDYGRCYGIYNSKDIKFIDGPF